MTALISLKEVTKSYRSGELDVPVLRGIDLTIDHGEYLVVMGRSGSGKSTLMNILGCLDRPSSGRYELDGNEVHALDDDALSMIRGKTIGFVFQSFHLLRSMTLLENVALPMTYQSVDNALRFERARDLLERVGLGHRVEHRPNQVSGGERQRTAIARALVNQPSLLLADEPTGNLDSKAQASILELFRELHREMGVTIVIVTHDPQLAQAGDRVVYVSDGRVVDQA